MKVYVCHQCRAVLYRQLGPGYLPLGEVACVRCGHKNMIGGAESRQILGATRQPPDTSGTAVPCEDCGRILGARTGDNWRIPCVRCGHQNFFFADAEKVLDASAAADKIGR